MHPFSCADIIFEAAADDDSFRALASQVAEALKARSGVFHWRHLEQDREEISYSGYFAQEQMDQFSAHFTAEDIWSQAVRKPVAENQAWSLHTLVPEAIYERSRIYNEWIRPMGDDTFHCLGAVIRNGPMVAEIGFHRGRGQPRFSESDVAALNAQLDHFSRLMKVRHRLSSARTATEELARTSDVIGHGIFTLDCDGRILHQNSMAGQILERRDGIAMCRAQLSADDPRDRLTLTKTIEQAGRERLYASALRIGRSGGGAYDVSVLSTPAEGRSQIVVVVSEQDGHDRTLLTRLRSLYGLSSAEAEIAVALAAGSPPSDIAQERCTSIGTVRSQLKAIASKLGCSRQSEIVSLVYKLPRLGGEASVSLPGETAL
jgi:DNA-binding CsgD family transcriptional regulator